MNLDEQIIYTLSNSGFRLSEEISKLIPGTYSIDTNSPGAITIDDDFIRIYEIKYGSIKRYSTNYALLLQETTSEMLNILTKGIGKTFSFYPINIKNDRIFYLAGINIESNEVFCIHKFIESDELSDEDKKNAESGNYIRKNYEF